MPSAGGPCTYRIDDDDRITSVGQGWHPFARDNGAPELTEDRVLGRSIWDFIVGDEVRGFYGELFASARARREDLMLPFHCDSPTVVRHMELTMRPQPGGGIAFEGRLISASTRDLCEILAATVPGPDVSIPICSLCRRMNLQHQWLSVEEAVVRERLFKTKALPRLEEVVCPGCREGSR